MALSSIWKQARPLTTISLGSELIEVKPLTLENSLKLILLLSPYVVKVESKWPRLVAALEATNGNRPHLLKMLLIEWRQDLAFAPGDVVQAFALLIGRDMAEVAEKATAKDLVMALPVLDAVNDFISLFLACRSLGIVVRYEKSTKD